MNKIRNEINIYTDGSCNHLHKVGGWAAIIILAEKEILLKGLETETTHNRMELLSVIKAFEYIEKNDLAELKIIVKSDSQYVVRIIERKEQLLTNNFITKKEKPIQNKDLVEKIIHYIDCLDLEFVKVKAHQKKSTKRNYNREVDKISRKIVREYVRINCAN